MFHRDIKPGNIIFNSKEGLFKLTDFGCATKLENCKKQKMNVCGTPFYMAPELVDALKSGQRIAEYDPFLSDLYSVGMSILKISNLDLNPLNAKAFLVNDFSKSHPNLSRVLIILLEYNPIKRLEGLKCIFELKIHE